MSPLSKEGMFEREITLILLEPKNPLDIRLEDFQGLAAELVDSRSPPAHCL